MSVFSLPNFFRVYLFVYLCYKFIFDDVDMKSKLINDKDNSFP